MDRQIQSFLDLAAADIDDADASLLGSSIYEQERLDVPVEFVGFEPVPYDEVALIIAQQANVSFSGPPADGRNVTVSFNGVPASDAFSELARLAKLEMEISGSLVKFIERGQGNRSFTTIAAGFEDAANLAQVIKQSNAGTATVAGSRIIVTGSPEQVARAEEIVNAAQGGRDGWMIEVVVCRVSDDLSSRMGISAIFSAGSKSLLGVNLSTRGVPDNKASINMNMAADLLLELSENGTDSQLLTRATVYVLEGGVASLRQGDVVPIAQRTISDQGTISVTGYTFVDTGFILEVAMRRVSGGRVIASIRPELSTVVGFVEGAPIISTSSTDAEIVLEPGIWTVVSGLRERRETNEENGFPGARALWGKSRSSVHSSDQILLLVRGHRVSTSG